MLELFKVSANELANCDDIEKKCKEILFPLICEECGHGFGGDSIASHCIYGLSKDGVLDYGVIDSVENNTYFLGIKLVFGDKSFIDCREILEGCMKVNPGVKYGLITDCINFEFYENIIDGADSNGIQLIRKFDIRVPTKDDEQFMELMTKKNSTVRQDYIEEDDFDVMTPATPAKKFLTENDTDGISLDEDDTFSTEYDNHEDEKPAKKKPPKKEPKPDREGFKINPFIIVGILAAVILVIFLISRFHKPGGNQVVVQNPDSLDWSQVGMIDPSVSSQSSIQYITLKAIISTKRLANDGLELSLLNTNIDDGAIIKFAIACGNSKDYVYSVIRKGECTVQYQIPESWANPNITVIAYMRFDEGGNYEQPANIKEKYGTSGENIIQVQGAPQYAITYTTTTHENAAVIAYINNMVQSEQNLIAAQRDKDLSSVEVYVDPNSENITLVPHGFNITSENMTELRHIYPKIYYDAASDTSYFYITCGYIGRDWINFTGVNLYADTYSWGYDIASNAKKTQLGGNALSEWVYFTDKSVLHLLNDMTVLCNSTDATIKFSGPIKKSYTVTTEEKENIKFFLYLYETYFGNGTKSPDPEWFNTKLDPIDMSYLKMPDEVRMRNSSEILDMEDLQNSINTRRAQGKTVSAEDQSKLERMQKTFKPVASDMWAALFTNIKYGEAYAIFDNDDEHGSNSYMRFYLYYDNVDGTIESGYVPYITVYSNKTVHIPLVTVDKNTSSTTRTLIETTISSELYSAIVSELKKVNYTYYGNLTQAEIDAMNSVEETPQPTQSEQPSQEVVLDNEIIGDISEDSPFYKFVIDGN